MDHTNASLDMRMPLKNANNCFHFQEDSNWLFHLTQHDHWQLCLMPVSSKLRCLYALTTSYFELWARGSSYHDGHGNLKPRNGHWQPEGAFRANKSGPKAHLRLICFK